MTFDNCSRLNRAGIVEQSRTATGKTEEFSVNSIETENKGKWFAID